jgi:nucleoid DNA-binding protein
LNEKIEKMIVDLFNKQKINYLNEIKNIKNEIISEIKEELKKDDQINIENLDDN